MSTASERLDTIERYVKLFKECVLIIIAAYLARFLVPLIPSLTSKLGQANIEEVSLAGIGIKLSQAQQKLEKAITADAPQISNTAKDESLSPEKMLVADAWESIRALNLQAHQQKPFDKPSSTTPSKISATPMPSDNSNSSWVYLGVSSGGEFTSKNFPLAKLPNEGESITAINDIYRRSKLPQYNNNEDWELGNAIGVIRSGQTLKIQKIQKVESNQGGPDIIWAKVVES